jgi:hypothetical protein
MRIKRASPRGRVGRPFEERHDLAGLRVPAELRFLEDRLSVARDLESTAAGRLESNVGVRECGAKLGRQTGGPWFVASNRAVLDFDFHEVAVGKQCSEFRCGTRDRMTHVSPNWLTAEG